MASSGLDQVKRSEVEMIDTLDDHKDVELAQHTVSESRNAYIRKQVSSASRFQNRK